VKEKKFLDVNTLDVNVIIIWLLDSEETKEFVLKHSRCKRYYNLAFRQ
jgi:hypothetical protein